MSSVDYDEVWKAVKKLQGKKLSSISGQTDLQVVQVDDDVVEVRDSGGQNRERSRGELIGLFERLERLPAGHVESLLAGSGTQRNIPETLLANLPWIEWTRVSGKKHLVYVGEPTHRAGTLRELSDEDRARVEADKRVRPMTFGKQSIIDAATEPGRDLELPDRVYENVAAAIEAEKHIILTGPPGTAKTTLGIALGEAAADAGLCDGLTVATATSDWTTFETIGGLRPATEGGEALVFEEGQILRAISERKWLLIDELNRSNFDRAFGQLFTVLSGHPVTLPYNRRNEKEQLTLVPAVDGAESKEGVLAVPSSWRIVGTMNVFDKNLLYQMSYALMRRFAFIEVPSPDESTFAKLISKSAQGDTDAAQLATRLYEAVHGGGEGDKTKDLGPAVFMDAADFLRSLSAQGADLSEDGPLMAAFYSYLLPQFEGAEPDIVEQLYVRLSAHLSETGQGMLLSTINEVLGLSISPDSIDTAEDPDSSTL